MNQGSLASRIRVCLLWKHPLVLAEIQRALSEGSFELLAVRIEPSSLSSLGGRLPQGTVLHVIEGDADDPPVDTIVRQVLTANPSARPIVLAEEFTEPAAF